MDEHRHRWTPWQEYIWHEYKSHRFCLDCDAEELAMLSVGDLSRSAAMEG